MKKFLYHITLFFFLSFLSLQAQEGRLSIHDLKVIFTEDEQIEISFIAESNKHTSKEGYTVIYAPKITNGHDVVSLAPIVVSTKFADRVWKKHEWAADTVVSLQSAYRIRNSQMLLYRSAVKLQPWMYESSIEVEEIVAGYQEERVDTFMLAAHAIPPYDPDPIERIVITPVRNHMSVGDSLAKRHAYILPDSLWIMGDTLKVYATDEVYTAPVYFATANSTLDMEYRANEEVMIDLQSALTTFEQSSESRITRIVVAGYASPDGSFASNDLLAWKRAVSLKKYVVQHTSLSMDSIRIYNGSADWVGLKSAVSRDSELPYADRVERIMKKPIKNGYDLARRMNTLRTTKGGKAYKHLLKNKTLENLNRAYVIIFYENNTPL